MADLPTLPARAKLAKNPDGSTASIPHALAHSLNSELLDVMVLLRAAVDLAGDVEDVPDDGDEVHSKSSRLVSLIAMADDKVRAAARDMEPYV